jgi:hypothetical protein
MLARRLFVAHQLEDFSSSECPHMRIIYERLWCLAAIGLNLTPFSVDAGGKGGFANLLGT